jgi:hypothetical protein
MSSKDERMKRGMRSLKRVIKADASPRRRRTPKEMGALAAKWEEGR